MRLLDPFLNLHTDPSRLLVAASSIPLPSSYCLPKISFCIAVLAGAFTLSALPLDYALIALIRYPPLLKDRTHAFDACACAITVPDF